MIAVTRTVHLTNVGRRKRVLTDAPANRATVHGRVPRISKLMALAIRFDQLLREGVVEDMSELARLARVTQPRITQIMNLLHLAPDIQEDLLQLPLVDRGRDPIHERMLRSICEIIDWEEQRRSWKSMAATTDRTVA